MYSINRVAAVATAGLLLISAGGMAAQTPLRLADVYRQVGEANTRMRAAVALVNAKKAMEPSAGLPPDPQVQLGAMNLSIPGFSADMPSSMAPSIQVMQMLPLFGKQDLNRQIARQSTAMFVASAEEIWWEVRAEAAMAYYEVLQADQSIAVMRQTLQLLEDFRKVAQAMYSAGEGKQADVLRAGVEVARMRAEIKKMETMRITAAARLNATMNQPVGTALGAPELPQLLAQVPELDTLRAWAETHRPMLARGRTEVEQAKSRSLLVRKEIWPDLTVGIQYGQRRVRAGAMDDGSLVPASTEHMGSVMVGFSVPLFAGKRQLKMREEAAAMRQMAASDLDRMRVEVNARITALVAELEQNLTLIDLYRSDVLPQAEANVKSAFSSYRVGQVDFMTLVDAQMTTNTYRQELAALVAAYGATVAELEMTIGRELPVNNRLVQEGR